MKVSIILAGLLLSGCSVHSAIIADSATTYHAIENGAVESNKLLPSSAIGAAVGSAALKYGVLYGFKNTRYCKTITRSIYSSSMGAAANNIAVNQDIEKPLVYGLAAGAVAFKFSQSPADRFCN